jgi:hypothetical protein
LVALPEIDNTVKLIFSAHANCKFGFGFGVGIGIGMDDVLVSMLGPIEVSIILPIHTIVAAIVIAIASTATSAVAAFT